MSDRILERAFQLARSGQCRNLGDINHQLKREDFGQIQAHLCGRAIQSQLKKLMAEAARSFDDPEEVHAAGRNVLSAPSP